MVNPIVEAIKVIGDLGARDVAKGEKIGGGGDIGFDFGVDFPDLGISELVDALLDAGEGLAGFVQALTSLISPKRVSVTRNVTRKITVPGSSKFVTDTITVPVENPLWTIWNKSFSAAISRIRAADNIENIENPLWTRWRQRFSDELRRITENEAGLERSVVADLLERTNFEFPRTEPTPMRIDVDRTDQLIAELRQRASTVNPEPSRDDFVLKETVREIITPATEKVVTRKEEQILASFVVSTFQAFRVWSSIPILQMAGAGALLAAGVKVTPSLINAISQERRRMTGETIDIVETQRS